MHAPWAHKGTDSQVIAALKATKPLQYRGNFLMAGGLALKHLRFLHTGRKRTLKQCRINCRNTFWCVLFPDQIKVLSLGVNVALEYYRDGLMNKVIAITGSACKMDSDSDSKPNMFTLHGLRLGTLLPISL